MKLGILTYIITGIVIILFSSKGLKAQNVYYMSNQLIEECEGILKDSEANTEFPGYYNHNEYYITTICVEAAEEITFYFTEFHTEEGFDFVNIYEGIGVGGTLLASYTGFGIPPSLTVNGQTCITIEFISDDNVTEFGWTLIWDANVEEPTPVDLQLQSNYSCEDPSLIITLSEPILCDSLTINNIQLVGAGPSGIASINPINCIDGLTSQFEINLSPVISVGGDYQVRLFSYIYDACDELHELVSFVSFNVNDCPMSVILNGDAICEGGCLDINAEILGGDGNYNYVWTPNASNTASINICPQIGDIITLTVTDGTGITATVTFEPSFHPNPVIVNLPTDTVCRSLGNIDLIAEPPGGSWTASGIHPNNAGNGRYQTWRTNATTGNPDLITYTDLNGCTVDTSLTVLYVDRGNHDGACLGSAPFQVSGGRPIGGTWSGTGIAPDGTYTPDANGTFTVTYTAPNGCSWGKNVYVSPSVSFSGPDTVCNTGIDFRVIPTPRGGIWDAHPASTWVHGEWFRPSRAFPGDNSVIYRAEGTGCLDTFHFFVKEISLAQNSFLYCPEALGNFLNSPFLPSIPGGTWSGDGAVDINTGLIDVSRASNGDQYDFRYTADGCYVNANIQFQSTIFTGLPLGNTFCADIDPINIHSILEYSPNYATVSGPGIEVNMAGDTVFNAASISADSIQFTISANGCTDVVTVYRHETPSIIQDEICILDPIISLTFNTNISYIDGPGILFNDSDLFDPSEANAGINYINLISENDCENIDSIFVVDIVQPIIQDIDPFYCFKDTIINPIFSPTTGTMFIDSIETLFFNPSDLPEGSHSLEYIVGTGNCKASDFISFVTLPPLSIQAISSVDTVCLGELVRLSANTSGGYVGGSYNISWGSNLGFGQVLYVEPIRSTQYIVELNDGCSDPVMDTIRMEVHNDFNVQLQYGPQVCSMDSTYVQINVTPRNQYILSTPFGEINNRYYSLPKNFQLTVIDQNTECIELLQVTMPTYQPIAANFIIFPNDCINTFNNIIEVNDLSLGAIQGQWYLNDSLIGDYSQGETFEVEFNQVGDFNLELIITNEGACADSIAKNICVDDFYAIHVPNAFTPNGDNLNDNFQFKSVGLQEAHWMIYDRYGKMLFESNDIDGVWDGKIENNAPESGHYLMVLSYITQSGESGNNSYSIHLVY